MDGHAGALPSRAMARPNTGGLGRPQQVCVALELADGSTRGGRPLRIHTISRPEARAIDAGRIPGVRPATADRLLRGTLSSDQWYIAVVVR